MQMLQIQGYSYEDRQGLLPVLTGAVTGCGGWVLDRKMLSAATLEIRVEVELRAVLDLYAAMVAAGLELTRSGHLALTGLCLCQKHFKSMSQGKVVTIRIEISFLEEANLNLQMLTAPRFA